MSRRTLLGFCALGAGVSALVLGVGGAAAADPLPPLTLPPATLPPLVQTPGSVNLVPGDGFDVPLPPLGPNDGDGLEIGLPGFPPITAPVTVPATPTSAPGTSTAIPGSSRQDQIGPAPTFRTGSGDPGAASGPTVTVPGGPQFEAARINGTSARVVGVIDDHHHGGFWSTIGSAAVTYWFWFALCVIALGVRFVAIAAWRDRMRATD
jgi:hypothetical protein